MIEKLYAVAKNGLCGIRECQVIKETPKTYRLKFEIVRKSQMQTNFEAFFTDEEEARDFYESIVHPKKTNADRIREMSDEELADELMLWRCEAVARHHGIPSEYPDTQKTILDWLRQTAEVDNHEAEP